MANKEEGKGQSSGESSLGEASVSLEGFGDAKGARSRKTVIMQIRGKKLWEGLQNGSEFPASTETFELVPIQQPCHASCLSTWTKLWTHPLTHIFCESLYSCKEATRVKLGRFEKRKWFAMQPTGAFSTVLTSLPVLAVSQQSRGCIEDSGNELLERIYCISSVGN